MSTGRSHPNELPPAHSVAVAGTISPVLQRVGVFVLLTYVISAPFEYLAISAGSMGAAGGLYALGGMWSPGIAAFITTVIFRQPIRSFGWRWGKTRYQLWSILRSFPVLPGGLRIRLAVLGWADSWRIV